MNKLIYLAAPYTDPDISVVLERVRKINQIVAKLFHTGHFVFSPISHCHEIASVAGLPTDFEFWCKYDELMISKCDSLYVLTLDGWQESHGVSNEIAYAINLKLPVLYIDPV